MTIFFSGGCKNGKSTLAEDCARALASGAPLYYIATMVPKDEEDHARIARHVAERAGKGFATIECAREITRVLEETEPGSAFLLDSVTALLSNEMFRDGIVDEDAGARTAAQLREFAARAGHAVFVSDYLYSDGGRYDEYTEGYRRALALCDKTLAACCDTVVEVVLGQPIVYKGALPL